MRLYSDETLLTRVHRVLSRCITKPTNRLAESEVYMKSNDIRMAIYKVFCLAAKNHGQAFGE